MKLFSTLLVLLFTCDVLSQGDNQGIFRFIESGLHLGFIIPHAKEVEPVSNTFPVGADILFHRQDTSYRSWRTFSTYWSSGVRITYYNFQNRDVLGSAFLLNAFAEPIIISRTGWLFSVGGGMGISYHTQKYDEEKNPTNQFFGTKFNFYLSVFGKLNYKITDHLSAVLTTYYNHISNGGIKQPNFGMNFPTLSLGMRYMPEVLTFKRRSEKRDVVQGFSLLTQVMSGYRVVDASGGYPERGFVITGMNIRTSKQLTNHYGVNFGGEFIFDGAIREMIRRSGEDTDYKRAAINIGQDLKFGRAVFTQLFGFYVYSPYKASSSFYQKYELSYKIRKNIGAGFFLKAHGHVAELMGVQFFYFIPGL
ncbi:MAG TPA: acyloxyacyl hydrolase [Bacteroidales bacterium]|nr:acyloxyacyl hydrolase [Bacteroidales bacterium]